MRVVQSNLVVFISKSLRHRAVHMVHHTQIAGHRGGRRMFHYLHKHLYWPFMSVNSNNVVKTYNFCACERIKLRKHATELELILATESLAQINFSIPGSLI